MPKKWESSCLSISLLIFQALIMGGPVFGQANERQLGVVTAVGKVAISITDELTAQVDSTSLRTAIEFELRRAGIQIGGPSAAVYPAILIYSLTALPDHSSDGELLGFSVSYGLDLVGTICAVAVPVVEDARCAKDSIYYGPVYQSGGVAYWGIDRARDAARRIASESAQDFANKLLAVRQAP